MERVNNDHVVFLQNHSTATLHCPPGLPRTVSVRGRVTYSVQCTLSRPCNRVLAHMDHFTGLEHPHLEYVLITAITNESLVHPNHILLGFLVTREGLWVPLISVPPTTTLMSQWLP